MPDSIKTMQDVKDREYDGGDGRDVDQTADYSVMSVSSCCFSEDILQEHTLMRAN